jgi:DNA polymerase zeta
VLIVAALVCHAVCMLTQVLQRCLNARQFALKLIANVSYGYTSASFSGRMPCAELADAIVQVSKGG